MAHYTKISTPVKNINFLSIINIYKNTEILSKIIQFKNNKSNCWILKSRVNARLSFSQSEKITLKTKSVQLLVELIEAKDRLFLRRGAVQMDTDHHPQLTFSNERIVAS